MKIHQIKSPRMKIPNKRHTIKKFTAVISCSVKRPDPRVREREREK